MIILINKDKSLTILDKPVSGARFLMPSTWNKYYVYELKNNLTNETIFI